MWVHGEVCVCAFFIESAIPAWRSTMQRHGHGVPSCRDAGEPPRKGMMERVQILRKTPPGEFSWERDLEVWVYVPVPSATITAESHGVPESIDSPSQCLPLHLHLWEGIATHLPPTRVTETQNTINLSF